MAGARQLLQRLQTAPVTPEGSQQLQKTVHLAPACPSNDMAATHLPGAVAADTPPPGKHTRSAWQVIRAGEPVGYMVGQPMTYDEALTIARWRWADADILES
jgi:hypothetical protein